MAKKRRNYKNRNYKKGNIGFSIFFILLLIGLMTYASYLLYSFAKSNGLFTKNSNQEINKISENKKENQNKLDFLTKLFSNSNLQSKDKSTENQDKLNEENIQKQNSDTLNGNNNQTTIINNAKENINQSNTNNSSNDSKNITKGTEKIEDKSKENYKINSKNFILFLAALNDQYELYLTKKTEKIDYTDSPVFSVITFLINYKPSEPYINLIPGGTKLLGAWIKQGILYLDFNQAFLNNKNGLKSIEMQIYQIVYTAMQFEGINGVRFLIEGNTKKYFSDEGFLFDITFKKKI